MKTLPDPNGPLYWYEVASTAQARIRELEAALRKISDGDYSDAFDLHSIVTNALASSPDADGEG